MVEEEKMARDVYAALAIKTGSQRFANISRAEQIHLNEVSAVLKTYGIWDPTLTRSAGVFYNQSLGNLYTALVAKGSLSWNDAKAGSTNHLAAFKRF